MDQTNIFNLLQQLNNGAINNPLNNILGTTQSNVAAGPLLFDACPGLNRVTGNYSWVVPYGSSPDKETYCHLCAERLHISGTQYVSDTPVNCDSFLKDSVADNGVFNVSFWDSKLKKLYSTANCDDFFTVTIPSGSTFSMLITGLFPKANQSYRYELLVNNEVIVPESKVYHRVSSLVKYHSKKTTKVFAYVDSANPAWDLLQVEHGSHTIIKPGQCMELRIHLYNSKIRNFDGDSQQHYGRYSLNSNHMITTSSYNLMDYVADDYAEQPKHMLPMREMVRFTKKPVSMKFVFLTDATAPDTSEKLLSSAYQKLSQAIQIKLKKMEDSAAQERSAMQLCEEKCAAIDQSMKELSARMDTFKEYIIDSSNDGASTAAEVQPESGHDTEFEEPPPDLD